jgi:multiple antibiotic resistance protein
MLTFGDYFQMFTAILLIVNPIGAVPVFASITADQAAYERKRTARTAAISVAIILTISAFSGQAILKFFGINIHSFRIAGGILLLLMALAMLHARQLYTKHTPEEFDEAKESENVAVVPLATPLMAGPVAISTVIIYAHSVHSLFDKFFIIGSCWVTGLIVWLMLRIAIPVTRLLGKTGVNILNRVMGLILSAIAVQFIAEGARAIWNG